MLQCLCHNILFLAKQVPRVNNVCPVSLSGVLIQDLGFGCKLEARGHVTSFTES